MSSVCAVVIAVPLALASIPSDGAPMYDFLAPPHQFDPVITLGSVFVSVLPVFLGYYHLGRLGALLSLAISAVTCFAVRLCAFLVFAFEFVGQSAVFEMITALSGIVVAKYVAVTPIDSSQLVPTEQETAAGWQSRGKIALGTSMCLQ